MIDFQYRRIGANFHRELRDLVFLRQSTVLVSLRDMGKRYVQRVLANSITKDDAALIVEIEFPYEPAVVSPKTIRDMVSKALLKARLSHSLGNARASGDDDLVLAEIRALCENHHRPIVMLANNVDSMAHHLAQLFLREVRSLIDSHGLTAVLTGEENLRSLVYGPDSEFNCANNFAIQGFEQDEFLDYLSRHGETARIPFSDKPSSLALLFSYTGGNIHIARAALWAFLEAQVRKPEELQRVVSTETIEAFLQAFPVEDTCGLDVFQHTKRIVSRSVQAWKDLERLLRDGQIDVPRGSEPRSVEVASLVIREHDRLKFASPIMCQFARRHYDDCELGDLYAIHGDWEAAFGYYERMPVERRFRPAGSSDRNKLTLVIKALEAKLHAETTIEGKAGHEKLAELKNTFSKGCRLVFGFSGVSFWTRRADWELLEPQTCDTKELALGLRVLRNANPDTIGSKANQERLNQWGALAVLPSVRPDQRDAVVVTESTSSIAMSRERDEFLRDLLDQFTNAYDHVIATWGIRIRLEARHRHLEVATAIVNAIGETVRNPKEALKHAGQELLNLGYRRIMFSLVDVVGTRIRGVVDCIRGDSLVDVARETDYALSEAHMDIQPWVVVNKTFCIVKNCKDWETVRDTMPPINTELCGLAETGPFAVVPMFIRRRGFQGESEDEVFGTIHVEREDGLPPSEDDVEDLMEFGRQMAAAANQTERVHALLTALHCDQDSVVILDHLKSVRFANEPAAGRLNVPSGWHDSRSEIRLDPKDNLTLSQDIASVIATCKLKIRYDTPSEGSAQHREEILCAPLPDWRVDPESDPGQFHSRPVRQSIGAVVTLRDLTPLHSVFTALQQVANRATDDESTAQALLDCVRNLGYESARLYRIDPQNGNLLVSDRAIGMPETFLEEFSRGVFRMDRRDSERSETWWCLEHFMPRVYLWDPKQPEGPAYPTVHGLSVFNVHNPFFSNAWKSPGDFWLDLPLVAQGRTAIGKLTITCGNNYKCDLRPQNFELLKLFSALLGALLDALDRKERWMRDAADKAMATCAHNIRTKLASLGGFGRRYAEACPGNTKVDDLNSIYEPGVKGSFKAVDRIVEIFGRDIKLDRKNVSLYGLLKSILASAQLCSGRKPANLLCPQDIKACVDVDCIQTTLEEMIANSKAMIPAGKDLVVQIEVEVETRAAKEWIILKLRDNGPGVPKGKYKDIFQPLYSHRPYGPPSTGLGLNLVRRIIEAHGGVIYVRSEPSWGAVFVVELPKEGNDL